MRCKNIVLERLRSDQTKSSYSSSTNVARIRCVYKAALGAERPPPLLVPPCHLWKTLFREGRSPCLVLGLPWERASHCSPQGLGPCHLPALRVRSLVPVIARQGAGGLPRWPAEGGVCDLQPGSARGVPGDPVIARQAHPRPSARARTVCPELPLKVSPDKKEGEAGSSQRTRSGESSEA